MGVSPPLLGGRPNWTGALSGGGAANLRATGIGCFFDDAMHELLSLTDERWQSLYHFTIGGAVWDERLRTLAAYHHLDPKIEELPDAGLRERDIGERLGV